MYREAFMKQSYVYILKCSDNTYYTGVTSNLSQRIFQHETGFYPDCYTVNRRPIELVFFFFFMVMMGDGVCSFMIGLPG